MAPGRNDPCPCGSGKKYKHCCAKHDATASPLLRVVAKGTRTQLEAAADRAIEASVPWEADVTPMPVATETEPNARHAAVVLAANDVILHLELESHPPSDADGVARLIASAIDSVLARGGARPSRVIVRYSAVASALGALLKETPVETTPRLALIDDFAASFRQQVSGQLLAPISHPQTWAAWQLPPETLDRVFSAAATYYSAAPWLIFGDETPIDMVMSHGTRWHAVILGFGGEELGLVLYEHLEDYLNLFEAVTTEAGLNEAVGAVISLSFDARADLPSPMRREFTAAKWAVAGPSAYPSAWALNTIGGGLSVDAANDMATALEVMARMKALCTEDNDEVLEALQTSWTDEVSGTVARYAGDDDYLWDVPELLTPSLAEGARADSSARFGFDEGDGDQDAAIVARFTAQHPSDASDADFFVQMMHGEQGVQLPAVTEVDLRTFLYDLLPRKTMTTVEHGNAIRKTLDRFFDYLASSEELSYPWANAILRDDAAFEERWNSYPRERSSDAIGEWMAELYEDFDARVMLPSNECSGLDRWGEMQGPEESRLYATLLREWLIWRDAEIAKDTRSPAALWERLTARQAEWEQTPQVGLGGLSPSEAIAAERGIRRRAKPRPTRRR